MKQEPLFELPMPDFKLTKDYDLRVLVWSNPLVVDKIGKTFHYWKDSGFIYTKHLIKSLPENYRFYWVIPDKLNGKDIEWFMEANKNVELIYYPYSTSIHQNRYEFYGDALKKAFPYTMDIDLILNNQPEVSANLKVWAQNQRRDDPIIFSFYHWIDCEESRKFAEGLGGYSTRQYDGAMASDKIFFHSNTAQMMFINQMEKEFKVLPEEEKYGIFHPPPTEFGNEPFDLGTDKKIILFNHRLNATTNWKEVIGVMDEVYKVRQDFVLWITDDSKIQSQKELDKPYIIVKQLPFENYGYLIKNSHFGVCNHKGYSTWNMALMDSFYNGCFMLIPKDPCYEGMFGNVTMLTAIHHNHDTLLANILTSLSSQKRFMDTICQRIVVYADAFKTDTHIKEAIDTEIQSRMTNKNKPSKYLNVYESIVESNGNGMLKKEFVNKYWSFHVNSNFQKIRWALLYDGIRDDTTKREPTYYYI